MHKIMLCAALSASMALGLSQAARADFSAPGQPGNGQTHEEIVPPVVQHAKPMPLPSAHTNVQTAVVLVDVATLHDGNVIHVPKGAVLLFVRKTPAAGNQREVIIDPRQMLCAPCISMKPVNVFTAPPGYQVVAAYKSDVAGFEMFSITSKWTMPGAKPRIEQIGIKVEVK